MFFYGYIYQLTSEDIKTLIKNHYSVARKRSRSKKGIMNSSPSISTIKHEIGSILEDFKSEMLCSFAFIWILCRLRGSKRSRKGIRYIFP